MLSKLHTLNVYHREELKNQQHKNVFQYKKVLNGINKMLIGTRSKECLSLKYKWE